MIMNAKTDTRAAFCDKCHAAIRQYDTDGGLWLTDCAGGGYDCGAGGLHVAPAVIGATVDINGDGREVGTVESFTPTGVTVATATGVIASNRFSGLYARVAAMHAAQVSA